MFSTFLMAVVLFTLIAVAGAAYGVYLFAEAKWNKHPLSRCTYRRAASFASA
ncbi:hypothetical protein [Herbaspirillum robiniae]|uniref:Uncharacterized protein n=1 Tax=Herbaspirillum robiniae TaxID=2014887 RepID=A0ABX2LZX6_9BURK|nr:hypothetical protein [Herbaspirillum robiniae]NUU01542.1 hypothetical protein [Herbaspirillum robiniae]